MAPLRPNSSFYRLLPRVLVSVMLLLALGAASVPRSADAITPTKPLVLTYFFYWYDATTGAHLETGHGLRHHLPAQPTPSWRNPAWFKKELQDMAAAGIDVVLPVYWGFDRPDDAWSTQGLAVLAQAWQELASEGHQPPRIGLFLDTTIVAWRDLTTPAGMAWFAATFQDFFHRIPREQWATVDGRPIAFLFTSDWTAAVNQATFDYVYAQFQAEFGVRPYLVREVSWSYPILRWEHGQRVRDYQHPITTDNSYLWGAAISGYSDWNGYGFGEPIGVASIGPGYDDRRIPGRAGWVRERNNGRSLMFDFWRASRSGKQFIAVETWNEIHEGSGVAETVEFGRSYIELIGSLINQNTAPTISRVYLPMLPAPSH